MDARFVAAQNGIGPFRKASHLAGASLGIIAPEWCKVRCRFVVGSKNALTPRAFWHSPLWHSSRSSFTRLYCNAPQANQEIRMTSPTDVLKMIKEKDVKFVDLRFTDTRGKEQHVSVPAKIFTMDKFESGHAFDGS